MYPNEILLRALFCADRFISLALARTLVEIKPEERAPLLRILDNAAESLDIAREALLPDEAEEPGGPA